MKVVVFVSFVNSLITVLGEEARVSRQERGEFNCSARKTHLRDPRGSNWLSALVTLKGPLPGLSFTLCHLHWDTGSAPVAGGTAVMTLSDNQQ